jgi:para-nitrobenzyl esterase
MEDNAIRISGSDDPWIWSPNEGKEKRVEAKVLIALLLILAGIWFGPRARAAMVCDAPVETGAGMVRGKEGPVAGVCTYQGIPYAAPPVGELRWKRPSPHPGWSGVREALEFGPQCPQPQGPPRAATMPIASSEDCLTLNIWRPAKSGRFPVMLWIHYGGAVEGSGSDEITQGAHLAAEKDVVVVTINYRLGILGFLPLPDLAQEDPHGSTGNYGSLDMIQALTWVRDNIAEFSGDPGNVTLLGCSAGGTSICYLLAAPPAEGLFHRAIIETGTCAVIPLAEAYSHIDELLEAVGCPQDNLLPCLRAKPAEELIATLGKSFSPLGIIDGYFLPAKPIELFRQGQYHHVPVMVGTNKDEENIELITDPSRLFSSPRATAAKMRNFWGDAADEIMKMYSADGYRWPYQRWLASATDCIGSRAFAVAEAISGQTPVYLYRFDWDQEQWGGMWGAFHGLEVPLVFGNLDLKRLKFSSFKGYPNPPAARRAAPLSARMMSYWTNFAKNGDPNGEGLPPWPQYRPEHKDRIYLDNPISTAPLSAPEIERYQYFSSRCNEPR